MEKKLERKAAWELLTEYTKTPALLSHAQAVEAIMRHFARLNGEDEEVWGVAGLLHDLDYEKYPQEHCKKAEEIMRERGIDEVYIRAMSCHGYGLCTDVKPESPMEKTLYTVDELAGLINAACLVRPSRSVLDLEVKSLKKKFKDKAFAAGVNREVIKKGCEMLGMDMDDVMREAIEGMKERADEIGLRGTL
ncbi:MAG TPA: HDIG domain-containing protein [Candidatus Acetatifactor stercoripullorum]|uniref:HDIG domain-containing protein n=1 Tax=Candidatus Acetatifactor stercoripullorum TaxID=2838414 RepID=A0A9D1UBU7_9FIRM|nr:HDIG domain-containing metalloprotein [uncultured Acetatifactor sp.]HIW80700.1 HDIG domain-containing protein [Candidatus Acetatifactor stercoripullorum]